MGYDEKATRVLRGIERSLGLRGMAFGQTRRAGAILNALEVNVEDDDPQPNPETVRLLADALVAQARVIGADIKALRGRLDKLDAHLKKR